MAYTDETNIKNALERDLTSYEKNALALLIPAVKDFIDNYTSRTFEVDEEAEDEERYFDSDGSKTLYIDEAIAITKVEIVDEDGDVEDEILDFYAYPLNSDPTTRLHKVSGRFPNRLKSIKITGKFAYSKEAPSGIENVATYLIVGLFSNKGGLKSESIEGYSRAFSEELGANPIIKETLEGFVRIQI